MLVKQVAHRWNFIFLERGDHKRSAVFIANLEVHIELLFGYSCDTEMRMIDFLLVAPVCRANGDFCSNESHANLFFDFTNRGGDDIRIYRLNTSSWQFPIGSFKPLVSYEEDSRQ